jgi:hypothetical protein
MSTGSHPLVGFGSTQVGGEIAMKRKILRKTFRPSSQTLNKDTVNEKTITSTAGPFRTAMNLGDFLSRQYQSCGGSNQVNGTNSRIIRPKMGGCVSNNSCGIAINGITPLEIPLKGGNTKYVSDSSLYTQYKTLESINRNYNDTSFGGNNSNGSYTFINAVRH